jgi:hypothetical protein
MTETLDRKGHTARGTWGVRRLRLCHRRSSESRIRRFENGGQGKKRVIISEIVGSSLPSSGGHLADGIGNLP